MTRLVVIDKNAHKNVKVVPQLALNSLEITNMVPVVISEFVKLAVHSPIFLTKSNESGRFSCVALFGFEREENIFVKDGVWNTVYKPLNIDVQPFFLASANAGKDKEQAFAVCLDFENPGVQEVEGEPIFDPMGNETAYLENKKNKLAQLLDGLSRTHHFIDKLLELNLITPSRIDIQFSAGQCMRVDGTYTIDENKVNSLSTKRFLELRSLGFLGPIYSMVHSLVQVRALIQKREAN